MNTDPDPFKALAEDFYAAYAERNSSAREFADDVNTLGGSFHGGWVDTTRTHAIVSERDFVEVARYPLREIFDFLAGEQPRLF